MLILVVEDDPSVARFLVRGLSEEGHQVDVCTDGTDALKQATLVPYEAIVLDWSLPSLDGLSVLRQWRVQGLLTPVLVLTARSGVPTTVLALDAGADDYMSKPFSFEELLARLRALTRRSTLPQADLSKVHIGSAVLDLRTRSLSHNEQVYELSGREFALLDFLLQQRGEVLSRARILDRVWGVAHDPFTNVVDVYIRYLRKKLDSVDTQDSVIETVRGRGYRLRKDDQ